VREAARGDETGRGRGAAIELHKCGIEYLYAEREVCYLYPYSSYVRVALYLGIYPFVNRPHNTVYDT
jgi:hypothetical protein